MWNDKPWEQGTNEQKEREARHEYERDERARIAEVLGLPEDAITNAAYMRLWEEGEDEIKRVWAEKPWEKAAQDFRDMMLEDEAEPEDRDPRIRVDEKYHLLLVQGETWWSLERNAAAVGFFRVEDYLHGRAEHAQG
jgi:hypothetical protein